MTSQTWQTVKSIFSAACQLPASERAAWVEHAAQGDPEVLREVRAMLAVEAEADSFLETPALEQTTVPDFEQPEPELWPAPGAAIGPYRLLGQIGEGGMGIVFHARQQKPITREVAVKIIKPGMDTRQVVARFEGERQSLAIMDHPNIARVFDAGATPGGRPYFAMELVEGVPITRYCEENALGLRESLELFLPVCQAIEHAHQKGIIHRDIKPSNILVARREGRPVIKVIDFGLARALTPPPDGATALTASGMVMGTPDYMSPEQTEPWKQDVDTRADVYSLGAVLYRMLTGVAPLSTGGAAPAWERIRSSEPARPGTLKPLPREIDWILMKALAKDRACRYGNVAAFERDIVRYLAGEAVEAGPPSAVYRLRKFVGRHRIGIAAAAAFVALLAAATIVSGWMALRARRAEQTAQAVNDFLRDDLLAQASVSSQSAPGAHLDPDIKVRTALNRADARLGGKFAGQPLVEAAIRQTIGGTYLDLGLLPEAQRNIARAHELRRASLGERDPATLSSLETLAQIAHRKGDYARAEEIFTRVLAIRRAAEGERSDAALLTANRLGGVYFSQGKYAQGDLLLRHALELRRSLSGEEAPSTLALANSLGMAWRGLAHYADAERLFAKTLEAERRVLGPEHPETLFTMDNLGAVYAQQGKFAQAEPVLLEMLSTCRRLLGDEHPDTLSAMSNLANAYRGEGKFPQAEQLLLPVAETYRRVRGPSYTGRMTALNTLAMVYRAEGRNAEAENVFEQTWEAQRHALGEDHPFTLQAMHNLAMLYSANAKYRQGEDLFRRVLAARLRVLGATHPDTIRTMAGLGQLYLKTDRFREAETMFRQAETAGSKSDTWNRYFYLALLGASLAGQHRYAEAEPVLLKGIEGMKQRLATIPAQDRPQLERISKIIADLYRNTNRPMQAERWSHPAK